VVSGLSRGRPGRHRARAQRRPPWQTSSTCSEEAALADIEHALRDAREIGQAASSAYALVCAQIAHINCGNYATANAVAGEMLVLADELGSSYWKAFGTAVQGCGSAQASKASEAVQMITAGITAFRSTGVISDATGLAVYRIGKIDAVDIRPPSVVAAHNNAQIADNRWRAVSLTINLRWGAGRGI
jgi:hypothetical protein